MKKIKLSELQWSASFRQNEHGHILVKSALEKGSKIGVYNPFGQLLWLEKNIEVIIVPPSS